MNKVGVHFRVLHSLEDVAQYARRLSLRTFQCFLFEQSNRTYITADAVEQRAFAAMRRVFFDQLFVHGSYLINLARARNNNRHPLLVKELELAQRLEFDYIVLHPGSYEVDKTKMEGIDAIARVLNRLFRQSLGIGIVLENTAFSNRVVGSDLQDFLLIKQKLDKPEKLLFCVDTAHAFCYGYDITTPVGRETFFQEVDRTMGFAQVVLIHLNDTSKACGSAQDQHEVLGKGKLGWDTLRAFAQYPAMREKYFIMEMPIIPFEQEQRIVEIVRSW